MRYYKDTAGNVYAYNEIQTPEYGLILMTEAEVEAHLNPTPTTEQLADTARAERDQLIESVRWRIERHSDELALGREPTEPLEPLLQYVQALRDVPQQAGFPEAVEWPAMPAPAEPT